MSYPKTLLVSQDPSLMEAVRGALASTRGFQLEVVAEIEAARKKDSHERCFAVVDHYMQGFRVAQ